MSDVLLFFGVLLIIAGLGPLVALAGNVVDHLIQRAADRHVRRIEDEDLT